MADGGGVFGQEPSPGFEWPVGADAEAAAFVGGGDEPEQQLGGGVVQRGEPEFVADDQIVAEQVVDDFADAVVGQPAVEGVDQVGGGQVAHLVAGVDRGRCPSASSRCDLPGAGGPDQAQVLRGPDPFEGGR